MRYFIDTEFYEQPGSIDLISIGIVSEDGREYYAENRFFNWDEVIRLAAMSDAVAATPLWLLENVRPHLRGDDPVSIQKMRVDILDFVTDAHPEFWGWYCDYDWVVFCWIFGRMVDLPEHFPKFCRDIRQLIDGTDFRGDGIDKGNEHNALADAHWNKRMYDGFVAWAEHER